MKQFPVIISVLLSLLSSSVYSQSTTFPMENAKWCYSYSPEDNNQFYSWDRCVTIIGDTIVNNTTYAYTSTIDYSFGPHPFFREEGHQVFIWDEETETEFMIYDFNLMEQDTFHATYFWNNWDNEPTPMLVTTIDTLVGYDGIERKQYQLEGINSTFSTTWIEGIGDANWVFFHPNYFGGTSLSGGYYFLCFLNETEVSYLGWSEYDDCVLAAPTEQVLIPKITLYPNPTTKRVYIRSSEKIVVVNLYDVNGKKLFSAMPNNDYAEVELQGKVLPGIYFLEIIGENRAKSFQKLSFLPD